MPFPSREAADFRSDLMKFSTYTHTHVLFSPVCKEQIRAKGNLACRVPIFTSTFIKELSIGYQWTRDFSLGTREIFLRDLRQCHSDIQ